MSPSGEPVRRLHITRGELGVRKVGDGTSFGNVNLGRQIGVCHHEGTGPGLSAGPLVWPFVLVVFLFVSLTQFGHT